MEINPIGNVKDYPTMHYLGSPMHTQSMIAEKSLTEYFWENQYKLALREFCSHSVIINNLPTV